MAAPVGQPGAGTVLAVFHVLSDGNGPAPIPLHLVVSMVCATQEGMQPVRPSTRMRPSQSNRNELCKC